MKSIVRQEKKGGGEVEFLGSRDAGEIGKNYTLLDNILPSKGAKRQQPPKKRVGTGIIGHIKQDVWSP